MFGAVLGKHTGLGVRVLKEQSFFPWFSALIMQGSMSQHLVEPSSAELQTTYQVNHRQALSDFHEMNHLSFFSCIETWWIIFLQYNITMVTFSYCPQANACFAFFNQLSMLSASK